MDNLCIGHAQNGVSSWLFEELLFGGGSGYLHSTAVGMAKILQYNGIGKWKKNEHSIAYLERPELPGFTQTLLRSSLDQIQDRKKVAVVKPAGDGQAGGHCA